MILQALCEYYERKAANPDSGIALPGLEKKEIKFVIEIDEEGKFLNLKDTRENSKGKIFLLPKSIKRSGTNSWQNAFLLWDHYGYVLGHPKNEEGDEGKRKALKMAQKQNDSFVSKIQGLPSDLKNDKGVKAVLSFYRRGEDKKVLKSANWESCKKLPGCNMSFQLTGDFCLIPERTAVRQYSQQLVPGEEDVREGRCLVTGCKGKITRIHSSTPIPGAKSNAILVGCQKNSGFDSYKKEQAFNSPISPEAESSYTTALKQLAWSSDSRMLIGDTTTLFWSEKMASMESTLDMEKLFPWFFSDPPKDDPDRGVRAVKSLYKSVFSGKLPRDEGCRFYILGLAPNIARISVRFWRNGSVNDFAKKIVQHFEDIKVAHGPREPEHLSLSKIICSTALKGKMDNVPPNLFSSVFVSILDGTPYPITLVQQCIRRIRAERDVSRARAGILKAWINRSPKYSEREVIQMALDRHNKNENYRLGRLFAVLEKVQEEASPGINATIRDRYYGAASSSPVTVFSQLLKLKNHHLSKLERTGRKVYFEKEIGEIVSEIDKFPKHLTLEEQAFFSIGYYHQRQEFFKKNVKEDVATINSEEVHHEQDQ